MTRKYTTALTVTLTLSLVMASCGGMSSATILRSILFMRSIPNGTKKMSPGPLALVSLPSLNMTPRSYSYRIRRLESRATAPMPADTIPTIPQSMMHHLRNQSERWLAHESVRPCYLPPKGEDGSIDTP